MAGLWYGTTKPDMGLFLKPLTEALKQLYNEGMSGFRLLPLPSAFAIGVTVMLPDKSIVLCCATLLCTTCDLPARAMILNMTNFNGFYGCCYCLQPGM